MTTQRDLERTLDAYFAIGVDDLADRVIDEALQTIDHTPQRRRLLAPWWPSAQNQFAGFAMAAAVVIVVAGTLFLLSPSNQVGGPHSPTSSPVVVPSSPSLSPAPSATPSPSLAWEVVTSDRFGYRVELPVGWLHSAPVDDLPDDLYPGDESAYADRWDQPVQRFPYVVIAVIDPEPETDAAWLERNVVAAVDVCDASDPAPVIVDGASAERRTATCSAGVATEFVLFTHGGRIYSIESNAAATGAEAARAILDHVLETFTFTD
jgi:hypothetical protein